MKNRNLTEGSILKNLMLFSLPMMAGNFLQQIYNIADMIIVGRFIGSDALAAVGSAYTLMIFLTSLIIGLCMGSGALFSKSFGAGNTDEMRQDIRLSFGFIGCVTFVIYLLVFPGTDVILHLLAIPDTVYDMMRSYIVVIFIGIVFVFFYNFFAYSLFISQNYGAQKRERIKKGTKLATCVSVVFCVVVSGFIFLTAKGLMKLFVDSTETSIIEAGVKYLRIEGSFYFGIGILFLLYGYFRGIQRAEVSLVLMIISLGTRVVLSYLLAPNTALGVQAIWWSIPIGWILADIVGMILQKEEIKNGKKSYNR